MTTQLRTSDAQALVDAVAEDLEANVVFPAPYRRALYLRKDVTPEFCPLLVVRMDDPGETPWPTATNGCYEHEWRIVVEWWEAAGDAIESGGIGSETLAMRLLATTQAIRDRIEAWASVVPGIDARYGLIDGSIRYPEEEAFCWHSEIPVVVNPRNA